MAIGEAFQEHRRDIEEESESYEFECTDDSDDDPSFDIVEETRSAIAKLSIKKTKARRRKVVDDNLESEPEREAVEDEIPKLDKKNEKSFEKVEQLIKEGGHLEKLTLDQCKVYLRKYGLRLTGNKNILISRIREHREIIDGCGEMKYPAESFVFNCKGDACLGDVVIFEQNVYDMFNIASRSATGPPCGTRTVAGRIVKESYGIAKQQHTFTIEVLWSKGVKPLPPLHQLLIKGRNLYRIKTMRQRWVDEGERLKVLQEKHGRGSCARYSREIRMKNKERRTKGMVIKRKNSTDDHIPTNKENQHPQNANIQQMKILNSKEHKHEQEVKSNVTSFATTQKIGGVLILQQPPQSILGKPKTAVFSAQAGAPQPLKSQNLQHIKHGGREHHHHQAERQGFQAFELQNSVHVRPHHVHPHHYMAQHHEFLGGWSHLQHKNYVRHTNQTSWVPLQQQHPECQRLQPWPYFSQGH
uniref:Zinc finger CCCH domain-containing protein 62-like isoform X1 n=1 Tax=Cymbidium ensifolium TaxID=78740 RepID=A0A5J6NBV5_CYMEN|nr:zinc finger CCCH domain-containing protein 62-like isoform X1 [Cymbidium ensifolium]